MVTTVSPSPLEQRSMQFGENLSTMNINLTSSNYCDNIIPLMCNELQYDVMLQWHMIGRLVTLHVNT